jgi:acyl-CoA hydrolase
VCAGDPTAPELTHTTQCIIVFVAIDREGKPSPVPAWEPTRPADIAQRDYAQRLMELRKSLEGELGRG